MGMITKVVLGVIVIGVISAIDQALVKYQAAVGYYKNNEEIWYYGQMTDYQSCIREAMWKFNDLNRESNGRAFSWICLKWAGGSIIEKVR